METVTTAAEVRRAVDGWRRQGLTVGFVPTMEYLLDTYAWDFALIMLNVLEWDEESERRPSGYRAGTLYRMLTAKKLPVFVMEPLGGGRVASLNRKAKKVLEAAEPERSLASWGMRFVASLPNVQTVLSGMGKLDQVVDNVRTFSGAFKPMTPPERSMQDGDGVPVGYGQ